MSTDQKKQMTQKLYESAPSSRQAANFLTAATLGAKLHFLSGLTLTGTVIALIMATPLMVLFSPVLVPAGIAILLVVSGLSVSGGCGVAAITSLSWIYNYVQGKHPTGADQLDYATNKLASTARDVTEKARGSMDNICSTRLRRLLKAKDLDLKCLVRARFGLKPVGCLRLVVALSLFCVFNQIGMHACIVDHVFLVFVIVTVALAGSLCRSKSRFFVNKFLFVASNKVSFTVKFYEAKTRVVSFCFPLSILRDLLSKLGY